MEAAKEYNTVLAAKYAQLLRLRYSDVLHGTHRQFVVNTMGQPVALETSVVLDISTVEDGSNTLSTNVCYELPTDSAQQPRRLKTRTTQRRISENFAYTYSVNFKLNL